MQQPKVGALMPYAWLSDSFYDDPKVRAAGPIAAHLFIAAISYSNRQLTDGFVPSSAVESLLDLSSVLDQLGIRARRTHATALDFAEICASENVRIAGRTGHALFEKVDGGYQIVNFHKFSKHAKEVRTGSPRPTREEIGRIRSEAGKKGADARWTDGKTDGKTMASDPIRSDPDNYVAKGSTVKENQVKESRPFWELSRAERSAMRDSDPEAFAAGMAAWQARDPFAYLDDMAMPMDEFLEEHAKQQLVTAGEAMYA